MQFIKSTSRGSTEIFSYTFQTKNQEVCNDFINSLSYIPNVVITDIALEHSGDSLKDKKAFYTVPVELPMQHINDLINKYNADLLHISLDYEGKAIEIIIQAGRLVMSMCMVSENNTTLSVFSKLMEFAMSHMPKRGEWIKPSPYSDLICSVCRKPPKHVFGEVFNYCPHCGAQNERKDDSNG